MKRILRIGALLLLAAMLLCGCNAVEETTEGTTKSTSATSATSGTTATTQQTSGSTDDQGGQENNNKPTVVRKKVALTFDDGPDDQNTKILIDELKKYGFNATFFVVGSKIDGTKLDGSEIIKYMVANGNEVGVHAYTNETNYNENCSDERYESEIRKTEEAIHAVLPDYEIKLMRPVEGLITDKRVSESKYPVMHWNIDTFDWKYTGQDMKWSNIGTIVDTVKTRIKEGDIVLMHEIHDNSLEAAIILLEWLYDNGYEVVTVSELFDGELEPGRRYYRAN
jgi:peptidoglycan/xylan/chitin deacetylase (PgdA/CDA1 family)